jgi:hypothetical protein
MYTSASVMCHNGTSIKWKILESRLLTGEAEKRNEMRGQIIDEGSQTPPRINEVGLGGRCLFCLALFRKVLCFS